MPYGGLFAALVIMVLVGCGGDDLTTPTEDSGIDAVVKDSTTGDTSMIDAAKDSNKSATVMGRCSSSDTSMIDAAKDSNVADTSVSDASDASVADASPLDGGAPDASVVCGNSQGFGYASQDGGCGIGEQYACNADKYELLCECPAAACTCKKNGVGVGSVAFAGCPGCKQPNFATVATGCGVPH